jgi:ABC-type branched-subunit amino acid transport system substrate-binding protein
MTLRRRPRTRLIQLTAFASAASLMLLLAACGSSSPSGSTSTPANSAPAAGSTGTTSSSLPASGKGTGTGTVRVGVQCSSTGYAAEPECITTFNALAAYANAHGGINGYKIAIDNCDTSSELTNPSVSAQCATKQVTQDGDIAFVGLNGPLGVTPVAQAHNIPIISPIDVEPDYDTSPVSFPVYAWQAGAWQALIDYLSTHGFKHPAYTNTDSTIGAAAVAAVQDGYGKIGITPKSVVALLTAVSFQPQVETLYTDGVDSVYPILADPAIVAMVQESDSIGFHPAWATDWDAYDQRVETILGPLGSSASLYTTMPFKSYETAGAAEKSIVAKYAPGQSWEFSFVSILNWIGTEILFQALEKMSGPATPAKLLAQLHSDTFTSEWLPAPVNWKNTTGRNCQIASTEAYIAKMENGVWTQIYGPFNAPPAPVTGCHTGT